EPARGGASPGAGPAERGADQRVAGRGAPGRRRPRALRHARRARGLDQPARHPARVLPRRRAPRPAAPRGGRAAARAAPAPPCGRAAEIRTDVLTERPWPDHGARARHARVAACGPACTRGVRVLILGVGTLGVRVPPRAWTDEASAAAGRDRDAP